MFRTWMNLKLSRMYHDATHSPPTSECEVEDPGVKLQSFMVFASDPFKSVDFSPSPSCFPSFPY